MNNILEVKPIDPAEFSHLSMLSGKPPAKPKMPDILNFSQVEKIMAFNNQDSAEHQQAKIMHDRLIADELLIKTHDNLYIVYSYADYENYYNNLPFEQRENTSIVRRYWFGQVGVRLIPYQKGYARPEEIEQYISDLLVNSIKDQVQKYKENALVCNLREQRDTGKLIPHGTVNYRAKFIGSYNGVGLAYTTYKYKLILALAGEKGFSFPEIPEDSLTKAEYDELKAHFGFIKTETEKKGK